MSSTRIRLQRFGQTHRPWYRIVACARHAPRDGKFKEILGTYNPIPDSHGNKQVMLKVDSIKKWMMHGAEPSERVAKLLAAAEILPPTPRRWLPKSELPSLSVLAYEPDPEVEATDVADSGSHESGGSADPVDVGDDGPK